MIEVVKGSMLPTTHFHSSSESAMSLGERTLVGEIVDSKCYLGVMNPGSLTPHRACAIRCISGGIPPVLLVHQTNGTALYFLLTSRHGRPVNKEVLDIVAISRPVAPGAAPAAVVARAALQVGLWQVRLRMSPAMATVAVPKQRHMPSSKAFVALFIV